MNFYTEKVSKEDVALYDLENKGKKYWTSNFDRWYINEDRDIFLLKIKSSSRIDDEDFGTYYFLMNFKGRWIEVDTLSKGDGVYKGPGWTHYTLKSIRFCNEGNQESSLSHELSRSEILGCLKDALIAYNKWLCSSRTESTVSFESFV